MTSHSMQAILATSHSAEDSIVVDLRHAKHLDKNVRKQLLDRAMETKDMQNELFLQKVKARLDRYWLSRMPCKFVERTAFYIRKVLTLMKHKMLIP